MDKEKLIEYIYKRLDNLADMRKHIKPFARTAKAKELEMMLEFINKNS